MNKNHKAETIDESTIGNRIKNLRKKKHLTQVGLGLALGMSHSTISKLESNSQPPDMQNILNFSNFFGVSPNYLLLGTTASPDNKTLDMSDLSQKEIDVLEFLANVFRKNAVLEN